MNDLRRQGNAFAEVCRDLLRHRFESIEFRQDVRLESTDGFSHEIDLVGREPAGAVMFVEIKAYRSLEVPTSWLLRGVEHLLSIIPGREFEGSPTLKWLVISARASREQKRILLDSDVELVDFDVLYEFAGVDADLSSRLDAVLGSLVEASSSNARQVEERTDEARWRANAIRANQFRPTARPLTEGANLCRELRAVPVGKKGAGAFEGAVQKCLEYLFSENLTGWTRQRTLDNGLRVDFAAKISGSHAFWADLVRDFSARYIVFECKNYRKAIDQTQVYSTEKYLYLPARRSVAIFISPNGADRGAIAAMKGAVRETGKLMISLTIDDVCTMLHQKDSGDEIHATLSTKVDEMLLTISR